MVLIISGIMVEVSKSDIKTMRLYVKPPNGKVMVSAPLSIDNEDIVRFVHSKKDWIKRHVQKFNDIDSPVQRKYVSGETISVWGKLYTLHVKYGGKSSLLLSGKKAVFLTRRGSTTEKREKYIREWYRKQLKKEVALLLPKWEKKTALKVNSWQTKYMKTRWGSCKTKSKKICLNVQLAKYPVQCLEYIILHELIHFIERKHDARFKNQLDRYMPDWREVKNELNRQALM